MQPVLAQTLNGVNVDHLVGTVTAVKENPEIARFQFRAHTDWVNGFVYSAAAQGIRVDALDFNLEGDLDLQGFLGLSEQVRPGYKGIRVTYRVKSDAPRKKIEELCAYVQKTSPVLDIIRNPVPVTIMLEA